MLKTYLTSISLCWGWASQASKILKNPHMPWSISAANSDPVESWAGISTHPVHHELTPRPTPLAPMLLWAPHFHEPWPQEIKSRMKEGIMLVAKFDQFWMEIRSLTETNLYQYGFMIKVDPSALRFDLNICHEAIGCDKFGRCTVAKQKKLPQSM